MKNIKFPVYFTTAYLLVYTLISQISPDRSLVMLMFMFSPFLIIWMVYRILKYGVPSTRTFDDYFYDDVDIKRIPVKEASEHPDYFDKRKAV